MDLYEVVSTHTDGNKWPTYTNSASLSALGKYSETSYAADTFEGYLSYVLIEHQICEDYAILLLRHAQFTVRLHVILSGFNMPMAKYEEPGVRTSDMFGRLLQSLENTIDFNSKSDFIAACRRLNQIRNRLAHKLIDGIDLAEIKKVATEYREGTSEVVGAFNSADEHFSYIYTHQIYNPIWDYVIKRQIERATTSDDRTKWEDVMKKILEERKNPSIHGDEHSWCQY